MPSHEQQAGIRIRLDHLAVYRINEKYTANLQTNSLVEHLKNILENDIMLHQSHLSSMEQGSNRQHDLKEYHQILLDIFGLQRRE